MQPTSIKIIEQLREQGHQAFWAGGCVRDMLLGIKPKDYDIVTSARPEEIEAILETTIPIGKEFGVILALQDGHNFEIATFRSDSGYSDGRRPDAVEFTTAEEDAKRRDFTINGMFYDPTHDKVFDYVGGQIDLENKLIRFIGNPEERIKEDHLRILRAIRFKNVYDFQYHPDTYQAIKKHINLVKDVSPERVADELNKMIISPRRVDALNDLADLGLLELILPEISALKGVAQPDIYHQEGDVFTHTMACLKSMSPNKPLSLYWAVMLHDVGKAQTFKVAERIRFDGHAEASAEIAKNLLKRLKFSRRFIQKVSWLCEHHMSVFNVLDMPKQTRMKWFLKPWFLDLLEVHKADASGAIPVDLAGYQKVRSLYDKETSQLPAQLPKLLSGEEVMQILQLKPGPKLGLILEEIADLQKAGELVTPLQTRAWLKHNYLN
ncbi:phosphohydrolase [Candidatus Peregrinibacteria bacterium CG11_big_fil_rev_8_21_14_0_20_41_10]|nr:MAG: phosphohydrolase [Candidatus Peregrinibacteria bacterium CG11_big_fil_rev_8_21_14_0_20_41_10]PJC37547.1 MAG: phosphohydrolase [Candidatus Peregrinibacteria bacterium CG_4_9_14_0_2_um_filter_41_14]